MRCPVALALAAAAPLLLALCAPSSAAPRAPRAEQLDVVTSSYPLLYLVERVGGELVRARCPVPVDGDPAHWRPDDGELAALQAADLIVLQGAGFERWTAAASLPLARVVDTTRPFASQLIVREDDVVHRHGREGEHSHKATDPHTWLEPAWLERQAGVIAQRIAAERPEARAAIEARVAALALDLERLEREHRELGKLPEGQVLLAAHPAYDYLARRYGWAIESLDLDPAAELDEAQLAALAARARDGRARYLVWESAPPPATAERVRAATGLASLVVSPCETLAPARRAAGEDLLTVLSANLRALAPAFERPPPADDAPPR